MSSPGCGSVRAIRVAYLASVVLALAIASHVLAGGHQPELHAIGPAAILAIASAYLLTRGPMGFVATFALLGAAQFGFHYLAEWCPPWCAPVAHHMTDHSDGLAMPTAHVAAAAASAAIVAYGDRVLWAFGEWLATRLLLVALEPVAAENFCTPFVFTRTVPAPPPGAGAVARRGPPLTLAFA